MSDNKDELIRSNQQETDQEADTLILEDQFLRYGFIQLPKQILYARNLSRDAKMLYAILLGYAWQEQRCFPGYSRLCEDMQASENMVRKYMRELESVKLLSQRRRGLGKTNIYTLHDLRTSKIEVQEPHKSNPPKPQFSNDYKETSNNKQINTSNIRSTIVQPSKGMDEVLDNARSHIAPTAIGNQPDTQQSNNRIPTEPQQPPPPTQATEHRKSNTPPIKGNGRPPRPPRQRQGHGMQHISAGLQKIAQPPEQQPPARPHRKNLSAERPPVFVGAPYTQEDLERMGKGREAITRKGVFADKGDSPLPSTIPADHWQQLQTTLSTPALINGHPGFPTNGKVNHLAKDTPLFIDAIIEQFSRELGDDLENYLQNINHANKLFKSAALDAEVFRNHLFTAYDKTRRAQVRKKNTRGLQNKMPYFFTCLKQQLTGNTDQHGDSPPN